MLLAISRRRWTLPMSEDWEDEPVGGEYPDDAGQLALEPDEDDEDDVETE